MTAPLLQVRDLNAGYGSIQILFNVSCDFRAGEIVALLGTNGAGKSTLLKAISGLIAPWSGTVELAGEQIGGLAPHKVVAKGIAQMPGGRGVFTGLTVEENLALANWLNPHHTSDSHRLAMFPELESRRNDAAGNLSGGQQQMLALEMALRSSPRILLIDELSLGLAPTIVGRLLDAVREIRDRGTTVIVVEQSVNVALTLAHTAYFMEKGEIRFHGATEELLDRPDLLRSVFLHGASTHEVAPPATASVASGAFADRGELLSTSIAQLDSDAAAGPALEVRGLSKRFGGVAALHDVSFDVAPGEIVGFIGPNGAGKTTLFDAISGLLTPDSGRVRLHGLDVSELPTHRRAWAGLGRSFQDGRLFPGLTVTDTIAVALERRLSVRDPIAEALWMPDALASEDQVAGWVDELITVLGLEHYRDLQIADLSTGTRRVVDLACSLANRPAVLLLDEPSSGIAQREVEALGPLLARIRDHLGAAVLVIEHDMPLLQSISDRLVALESGGVVTIGQPDDVLNHPRVVSSYLGDSTAATQRSGSSGPAAAAKPSTPSSAAAGSEGES